MTEHLSLDLNKLKYMIKQGIAAIPVDKKHSEVVLTIGDTGVGKSTILSYLNGAQLVVKAEGMKFVLDAKDLKGVKIGHNRFSETSVPTKLEIDGMAFFDCPGFKDNKGEEFEISNSFFIQRLLDLYKQARILLVVDESHITQARADRLPKLLRSLLQSFGTFSDIQEGTILLINRCSEDQTLAAFNQELKMLSALKNDGKYLFERQERDFIQFLVENNRVVLFGGATKKEQGKTFTPTKRQDIMAKIKSTKAIKTRKIKNILSESAKLAIRDFIDQLADRSNSKIEELCQEIRQQYMTRRLAAEDRISDILKIKEEVMLLLDTIKQSKGQQLIELLTMSLPSRRVTSFQEDFAAVMFFKDIYDKTQHYYKNIQNKIYSQISPLLGRLDKDITNIQKIEEERAQQAKLIEKMKQEHADREAATNRALEQTLSELSQMEALNKQLQALKLESEEGKKQRQKIKEQYETEKKNTEKFSAESQQLRTEVEETKKTAQKIQQQYETERKMCKKLNEEAEAYQNELKTTKDQFEKTLQDLKKLQTQNEWLKKDSEEMSIQYSRVMKDLAEVSLKPQSKKSKYEDIDCPHFKNGGKCIHCIKKWKQEQKEHSQQSI